MQTPGRQVEPQTPMIAINRRVDMTLERLTKVEEDVVNIERPQRRIFSSVLSQFSTINNSMQEMRDLIDQDIKAKRKYYREETKILQKDSRNLQSLSVGFGRKLTAGALGLYGLSQLQRGNLGEGAAGIGGAAALLTPEILGVITTVVTTKLASSGLLGRGAGVGSLGTRVAGASKLRNPLLITAALAASLILPGLISSNQNADRRRQMTASRTIRGAETINKPDVDRFRVILARFDSILSNISLERKREGGDNIDVEILEEAENTDNRIKKLDPDDPKDLKVEKMGIPLDLEPEKQEEEQEEKSGFFDGFKRLFNFGKKEDVSQIDAETSASDSSMTFIDESIVEGDTNIEGEKISNTFNNSNLISMGLLEPGENDSASDLLPNMSVEMMSNEIFNVGGRSGGDQVINIDVPNQDNSSGFTGKSARPVFVSVGTKFKRSIDKFESASSLRTWGAFS